MIIIHNEGSKINFFTLVKTGITIAKSWRWHSESQTFNKPSVDSTYSGVDSPFYVEYSSESFVDHKLSYDNFYVLGFIVSISGKHPSMN